MYRDFGTVFLATVIAIIFVVVPLVIALLVAPSRKTKGKLQTYEWERSLREMRGFNLTLDFM